MLTVSLVGKKFSCSIQLQVSTENEGGGLELTLKAGEKCSNCPQSVSNVNATLNITIQKGCSNYVTKCKEMLMFLQEQALPKTMNVMKVHMVNREMKSLQKDDTRLFSCIKPKKRERVRCRDRSLSTDRLTTRGYSSDTDQAIRHPCASGVEHLSRMDILATPRMSRHRLKNAALLRNRRNREASKERAPIVEKELKSKNQTIELQLKESRKSRSTTAVTKNEKEVEKEGSLIYEGSSESSLCDLSKEGSHSLKTKEKKGSEESEMSDLKDSKATESDMSADSLECLDIEPSKCEAKQKRKKKPPRSQETISQADRKSQPSKTSIVTPLVFPSDFDDSSFELSDTKYITKEQIESFQNTNTNTLSHLLASTDEVYNKVKQSAQEIVQEVISSAIKEVEIISNGSSLGLNMTDEPLCESFDGAYYFSEEKLSGMDDRSLEKTSIELDGIGHIRNNDVPNYSFKYVSNSSNSSKCSVIASDHDTISNRETFSMESDITHKKQKQRKTVVIGAIKNAECSKELEHGPTYTPRSTQTSPVEATFSRDMVSSKEIVSSREVMGVHLTGEKDNAKTTHMLKENGDSVKLYDSHNNITKQIIHSVSRALHYKSKIVTPSKSGVLVSPDSSPAFSPTVTAPDMTASNSHGSFLSNVLLAHNHILITPESCTQPSEQYSIHKDLISNYPAMRQKPIEFQIDLSSSLQQYDAENHGEEISQKEILRTTGNLSSNTAIVFDDQDSLIEEFCKKLPYSSKEISSKIHSSNDQIPTSGYCFFIIGPDDNAGEKQTFGIGDTEKKDEAIHAVESVQRRRKTSLYRRSLSHQNERKKWQTTDTRIYHRSLSDNTFKSKAARANKCTSCPVLSEEDIVLEGLESHHQDVCNSLSQRTWIALRVHELWKANKHEDALKTCMELSGITKAKKTDTSETLSGSSTTLDLVGNKDIVLFLNILQQLPISGAAWTLDMCDLILAELKLFISTRIHTSHVEMTCTILQVVIKKVSGAVLKAQTANKEKPLILSKCVNHLRDVKERANKVLMARRPKMYCTVTTEDPIALKPVLRELLTVIQTLITVYTE